MTVSYGGSSITFDDGSTVSSGWNGFRNRFINGAMMVDQRASGNVGYANTTTSGFVSVDRVGHNNQSGANITIQQVSTAPTGFTKSLKLTVTAANASLSSGQFTRWYSGFEGLNMADLGWGTAAAQPITISFWVQCSVTGLHSITIQGHTDTGTISAYAATYTINSANTWEYKTITIPGATTGTWRTDSNTWGYLTIGHGSGSTGLGTANTWLTGLSGYINQASGTVNVLGTVGNTFFITGLQVERGSNASSFEYRPYGTELALCQRYFWYGVATLYGFNYDGGNVPKGDHITFPNTMRVAPTLTMGSSITSSYTNSPGAAYIQDNGFIYYANITTNATYVASNYFSASSEL